MLRKRRDQTTWPSSSKADVEAGNVEWPTMENGHVPKDTNDRMVERLPNGMRILDRRTIDPIYMCKGDTLQCTYRKNLLWNNEVVREEEHKLATYVCEEDHTIDTVIIVELDDGNLEALGLEYGLAGIFGTAKQ